MEDTILIGDFMLVNKFIYGVKLPFTDRTVIPVSRPKPGDIVIFRAPAEPDFPQPESRYARIFPAGLQLLPLFWDRDARFFKWYTPTTLVKRCVAVAGDTVECRDKRLYVNGRLADREYVRHKDGRRLPGLNQEISQTEFQQAWEGRAFYRSELSPYVRDQFGPVVVPEGCIFMMGDNRDNSEDGRFWGPLELRHVKGRPMVRYFSSSAVSNPPNLVKVLLSPWAVRLDRIGRIVR